MEKQHHQLDSRIQTAIQIIQREPASSLRGLAIAVGLSVSRLEHLFKKETGSRIRDVRDEIRIQVGAYLLRATEKPIKEIAWFLGYKYTANFSRAFYRRVHESPYKYRRDNRK